MVLEEGQLFSRGYWGLRHLAFREGVEECLRGRKEIGSRILIKRYRKEKEDSRDHGLCEG
mgnify:CR=1 FL=1